MGSLFPDVLEVGNFISATPEDMLPSSAVERQKWRTQGCHEMVICGLIPVLVRGLRD